jgi:hypothetical protein
VQARIAWIGSGSRRGFLEDLYLVGAFIEFATMSAPVGPERLTILEKAIAAHLPFSVGCVVVAVIAGAPGSFVVFYLGTDSLTEAWSKTASTSFNTVLSSAPQVPTPEGVFAATVVTFSIFLDLYLVRYLRRKVYAAESQLSMLTAEGTAGYARAFRVMGGTTGTVLFMIVFFILYFPARAQVATDPITMVGMVVLTLLIDLVYATAFWTYLSGLWGVYRFGRERLVLRPFYEDRLLGLRPLGHVVTTFALVFSLAITVTLGGELVLGAADSIAVNLVIVALGIAMLFLPLRGIHSVMARVKDEERTKLSTRERGFTTEAAYDPHGGEPSLSRIQELLEFQRFQLLKTEALNISGWPFEPGSVERLVAILLAIFGILMGRLVELIH